MIGESDFTKLCLPLHFGHEHVGTQIERSRSINMTRMAFEHVTITDRMRLIRRVSCVESAAEVLAKYWPKNCGEKYATAQQACLEAGAGRLHPDEVRRAFIDAAKEASIYVNERSR
ncbi:DUF982 domain-containing protein [Phyllobacterium bourgognense]|uniref:DUF982 domain-containing protein n=1 Tax=Phyllobacterium bourgognense TaxID=314236 RepID=UPI0015F046F1|nr:DUF982 domain-containing protein [Phyllobacterium bourgognense]